MKVLSATRSARLPSVDLLRGLVMVLMALDHVRTFFSAALFEATDLSQTTSALYATRWVTHLCAPTFLFLAGASAFLQEAAGKPKAALSRFLAERGLFLVALELTVVWFGWTFGSTIHVAQVIWVIGWSMVILAGLIWLPRWLVALLGAVLIAGHNVCDGLTGGAMWGALHVAGIVKIAGVPLFVVYPLVPWVAVMAVGYTFGPWLLLPSEKRRERLIGVGAALLGAFVAIRAWNVYGDPSRWFAQQSGLFTVLSFLDVSKYPPSLLFVLVTLGVALLLLAALDGVKPSDANPLLIFGRVPLFFYVVHLYLIHLAAALASMPTFGRAAFRIPPFERLPGFGVGLPGVYAVWLAVLAALYPVCRWYANVKQRRRSRWLAYL